VTKLQKIVTFRNTAIFLPVLDNTHKEASEGNQIFSARGRSRIKSLYFVSAISSDSERSQTEELRKQLAAA